MMAGMWRARRVPRGSPREPTSSWEAHQSPVWVLTACRITTQAFTRSVHSCCKAFWLAWLILQDLPGYDQLVVTEMTTMALHPGLPRARILPLQPIRDTRKRVNPQVLTLNGIVAELDFLLSLLETVNARKKIVMLSTRTVKDGVLCLNLICSAGYGSLRYSV